ncbi:MAG TPA: 50S ribosomal protein L4 [Flavobacteriales bacterium]|jgi:large subunit ribosomal protein L4|nr:50S ribosomal protein L4 [Flavobacteriales bacterium]
MKIDVYNANGSKTDKSVTLNKSVFGIEPNDHAIYLDVKRFRAAQRQGTHDTLHRGLVSGSTRKIKKQKGTGTARAGSIKNPLFRGGGTTFGPEPRDYTQKLNHKVKQLARRSALSYKAKEKAIMVVEGLKMEAPKTKDFAGLMNGLEMANNKTLMVLPSANDNVFLSSRNLRKHRVMVASDLSTYDIMNCNTLIFVDDAHKVIEGMLK